MTAKTSTFLPVYYFVGEDSLKRQFVADRLKKRIAALGDIDFNFQEFDGRRDDADDIIRACETLPWDSPYRYVLVSHADALSAAQGKILAQYIGAPQDSTILALSADGFDARSALGKAFTRADAASIVDCSVADITRLTMKLAKDQGLTIRPDAAATLVQLVGQDTVRLHAELEKLALGYQGKGEVTAEEIKDEVVQTAVQDVKPWEFLDAFCRQDLAQCLRFVQELPDDAFVGLLSQCLTRIRELMAAKSFAGQPMSALAQAVQKKDWQVKNYPGFARRFSPQHLDRIFLAGIGADAQMKSGTNPREAFTRWLLDSLARQ